MPRKFNDFYDAENKVHHTPQTWKCPKCEYTVVCLSALDVSHPCPQKQKKVTFFKKIEEVNKTTKKIEKIDKTEVVDKVT